MRIGFVSVCRFVFVSRFGCFVNRLVVGVFMLWFFVC